MAGRNGMEGVQVVEGVGLVALSRMAQGYVAVSGWEATDFLTKRDGTFIAQSYHCHIY